MFFFTRRTYLGHIAVWIRFDGLSCSYSMLQKTRHDNTDRSNHKMIKSGKHPSLMILDHYVYVNSYLLRNFLLLFDRQSRIKLHITYRKIKTFEQCKTKWNQIILKIILKTYPWRLFAVREGQSFLLFCYYFLKRSGFLCILKRIIMARKKGKQASQHNGRGVYIQWQKGH